MTHIARKYKIEGKKEASFGFNSDLKKKKQFYIKIFQKHYSPLNSRVIITVFSFSYLSHLTSGTYITPWRKCLSILCFFFLVK